MTSPPPVSDKFKLSDHPHALRSIQRIKSMGGLLGFFLVALGTYLAQGALLDIASRGLIGGVIGYLVFWWAAIVYWRMAVRMFHTPPRQLDLTDPELINTR